LNNSDSDGPSRNKPLFLRLIAKPAVWFLGILVLAVVIPMSASAGIFSFMNDILPADGSTTAPAGSVQNMTLLVAASSGDSGNQTSVDTQIVDDNSLLADAGPLGSAADVASSTGESSDQISVYTVRKGDSLSGIAKMFNVSVNTILWANDLKKGSAVHEGDQLVILPISGVQYTVKKGDTLASVAKKYGGDKEEIMAFNNLDSEKLTVGDEIIIPDGEVSPSASGKKPGGKPSQPSYSGYYVWPVAGGKLSQGLHGHNGVDIAAPAGTGILAAASGKVLIAKDNDGWNGGYGNYVVIKHSNGTQTLYAHMSSVSVNVGQSVDQSETIGHVGSTGHSTGNHCHFEVRGAVNPFAKGKR